MQEGYIVTFKNTFEAMNAEKVSKQYNLNIRVIPTPTYITKSCGISLLVDKSDKDLLNKLVINKSISVKNIFFKNDKDILSKII